LVRIAVAELVLHLLALEEAAAGLLAAIARGAAVAPRSPGANAGLFLSRSGRRLGGSAIRRLGDGSRRRNRALFSVAVLVGVALAELVLHLLALEETAAGLLAAITAGAAVAPRPPDANARLFFLSSRGLGRGSGRLGGSAIRRLRDGSRGRHGASLSAAVLVGLAFAPLVLDLLALEEAAARLLAAITAGAAVAPRSPDANAGLLILTSGRLDRSGSGAGLRGGAIRRLGDGSGRLDNRALLGVALHSGIASGAEGIVDDGVVQNAVPVGHS